MFCSLWTVHTASPRGMEGGGGGASSSVCLTQETSAIKSVKAQGKLRVFFCLFFNMSLILHNFYNASLMSIINPVVR